MKTTHSLIITFFVLIVIAALYRLIPGRPMGFSPQLAMALFAGATIRDKKWAFAFPIISLFLSDCLFQLLYWQGLTPYGGFYDGQFVNYLLFGAMTVIGFRLKTINIWNVALFSLIVAVAYFLLSNLLVWQGGGGFNRPRTFSGLMQCYVDATPFFTNSLLATLVFSAILFGGKVVFDRKPVPRGITA